MKCDCDPVKKERLEKMLDEFKTLLKPMSESHNQKEEQYNVKTQVLKASEYPTQAWEG